MINRLSKLRQFQQHQLLNNSIQSNGNDELLLTKVFLVVVDQMHQAQKIFHKVLKDV
jgi:hypothetical protein